jgi:hypothetical protein
MIGLKACEWLMANADAPIRYRVARELLGDINTAGKIETELLGNPAVRLWINNLNPQNSPKQYLMLHGSFDYCFENALLKAVQLGLHAGITQFSDAVSDYTKIGTHDIFSANLLTLADLNAKAAYCLKKYGMPERSLDEIRSCVGNGARRLVERVVPKGNYPRRL